MILLDLPKEDKVGFYIILCLPNSVMHPKTNTYARSSNSLLLHFYHIKLWESIHGISVYQIGYLLNLVCKEESLFFMHLDPVGAGTTKLLTFEGMKVC